MSFELPLFPLNVVLFPGMALPLHIFEPRYRLMISRCLEADKTFGVTLIAAGEEGQSNTEPSLVGTSAEILENTPFPDGRMNLQTMGRRRFRVISVREEDEYLIGTVEWLDDVESERAVPAYAIKVRDIFERYLKLLMLNAKVTGLDFEAVDIPRDPIMLSLTVAALLQLGNEQKQELLEMTSTAARLSYEYALLRRAEVVQLAFARRVAAGHDPSPFDESLGAAARYLSSN
jgi:Lon protease-like protein